MYGLCDCNNFYASCERVFNPALVGRPVVVLSNNDGCVIAVVFQKVCLGRSLQILQICKYSDSWFRTTRRGVLFFFLCYSLHSGNKSRSRSIRGTGLR